MKIIKRFIEWLENHKQKFILYIILSFILSIFVIQTPFWIGDKYPQYSLKIGFDAADILSYFGSFLTFMGTISLGLLALWQNQMFKNESDKKDNHLLFVENEKIRLEYLPSFLAQSAKVEEWSIGAKTCNEIDIFMMNKYKSYVFLIQDNQIGWIESDMVPAVPQNRVNEVIAIINCGNNTAHQVKFIMQIGEKVYHCDKSYSIRKDDQIFLFISFNNKINLNKDIFLKIRFFDTFLNIYQQVLKVEDINGTIYFQSYGELELITRSSQMQILK